jgi:DNA-binding transcriptional LysR family regulator
MELRHLRYFIAVAEELHFTRAAERLHIAQPPLSQQIQALETELGVALFERNRRRVTLTEAGKRFLDSARAILAETERAAETARRAARGEVGELRIGIIVSLPLTRLIPEAINDYRHRYPQVTLQLRDMTTLTQLQAVLDGDLDVGFARRPEEGVPDGLAVIELQSDPLCAVIHESHPLAQRASLSLAELRNEPFILYPRDAGSGIQRQILSLCGRHGFIPRVEQEAREATTHIGLVSARLGIAILPATVSCIHAAGVRYIPLNDPGATTTLILTTRKNDHSPLVARFVECVRTVRAALGVGV